MRFVWAGVTILLGIVLIPIFFSFIGHFRSDIWPGLPNMSAAELAFPAALCLTFFVVVVLAVIYTIRGRH